MLTRLIYLYITSRSHSSYTPFSRLSSKTANCKLHHIDFHMHAHSMTTENENLNAVVIRDGEGRNLRFVICDRQIMKVGRGDVSSRRRPEVEGEGDAQADGDGEGKGNRIESDQDRVRMQMQMRMGRVKTVQSRASSISYQGSRTIGDVTIVSRGGG